MSSIFAQLLFDGSSSLRCVLSIYNLLPLVLNPLVVDRFSLVIGKSRGSVVVNWVLVWRGVWTQVLLLVCVKFSVTTVSSRCVIVLVSTWLLSHLLSILVVFWIFLGCLWSLSLLSLSILLLAWAAWTLHSWFWWWESLGWVQRS